MLSKNKIKLINSLKLKKYRTKNALFSVEGIKAVSDFLNSDYHCVLLVFDDKFNIDLVGFNKADEVYEVSSSEFKKISRFKTASQILGLFQIPTHDFCFDNLPKQLTLYCDGIQDPGNLGTIIRTAAWFGIHHIVCSEDTVDIYNHKAVQASMGAAAKVELHYLSQEVFFEHKAVEKPDIFGADLEGENIYTTELPSSGIIVLGNEGSGIRASTSKYINRRLHIPGFSGNGKQPESLNVAVAGAVIFSEFKRRLL